MPKPPAALVVAPIHPRTMPVILTTPEEMNAWMTAPADEALNLQRPLPDDALRIVAAGGRQDPRQEATSIATTGPRKKAVSPAAA